MKNINEILDAVQKIAESQNEKDSFGDGDEQKKTELEAWLKRLEKAGVPKRYRYCTFENIEKRGVPEAVSGTYNQVKGYANAFAKRRKLGQGILFCGPCGRMKTTMAVAVMQSVMQKGSGAKFVSMPEMLSTLGKLARNYDRTELVRFEDGLKNTGLLVLDDFGAEYGSNWVVSEVDMLITHRYNEMKPTIITTNLSPGDISERYVARVYDRLRNTSLVLMEKGVSLRASAK